MTALRAIWGVLAPATLLAGAACHPGGLPPPSPSVERLPERISHTGLFADGSLDTIAADVHAYTPAHALWSDGADKRRWIRIPEGTRVDTSSMDAWVFPVGTELWKEFSRDGRRLETRLLTRVGDGPSDWAALSYVWNDAGTEAIAMPRGDENVLGTAHDVPSAGACLTCHGRLDATVLGFSAVQLAGTDLGELVTHAPEPSPWPGDDDDVAVLGYLHANCGSCHAPGAGPRSRWRPGPALDLWLTPTRLRSADALTAYRRSLGDTIVAGDPEHSPLLTRMQGGCVLRRRMPPISTDTVDAAGIRRLAAWIRRLPHEDED